MFLVSGVTLESRSPVVFQHPGASLCIAMSVINYVTVAHSLAGQISPSPGNEPQKGISLITHVRVSLPFEALKHRMADIRFRER